MRKGIFYFSILILIAFSFSCNRKWKETAPVEFRFNFHLTPDNSNNFKQINSGFISLNGFEFTGDRKKGGGVNFFDAMDGTKIMFENSTSSISNLNYDIPQGTYSRINLTLTSSSNNNTKSICLKGKFFTTGFTDTIPLLFEFKLNEIFSINALKAGGGEISIVKGTPTFCTININPISWIAPINKPMLDNAYTTDVDGIATIVISAEHNSNIYDTIVPRIKDQLTAEFQ